MYVRRPEWEDLKRCTETLCSEKLEIVKLKALSFLIILHFIPDDSLIAHNSCSKLEHVALKKWKHESKKSHSHKRRLNRKSIFLQLNPEFM